MFFAFGCQFLLKQRTALLCWSDTLVVVETKHGNSFTIEPKPTFYSSYSGTVCTIFVSMQVCICVCVRVSVSVSALSVMSV